MATSTNELVYSVGLVWDKVNFNGLNASINKSISIMATATAAAVAASGAMFALGKSYADTTDNLIKTSERLNTTTQDMQKLTFAAEDNGASMSDVESSLNALAKAKENMLRGSGDFEAFGRLGVNPTEYSNTADLLMDISDSVKDLSSQEATDLMSRVGISPQLLQTLQKGKDGLTSLGAEAEALGLISDDKMLQSSQTFMSGWQRASSMFKGVMNKVGSSLLDSTINPALEQFNKFASKHMKTISKVITDIFQALAKASEFIFSLLNRLAQPFIKLVNLLGGVENAAIALGVVIAALKYKTIVAMLPAILAIGALYIAFDELMSFLSGEESFIGDFFNSIGVSAEDLKIVFESVWDVLKMVASGWGLIFTEGGKALEGLGILIDKYLLNPIREVLEYLSSIGDAVTDAISSVSEVGSSIGNFASDAFEGTKSLLGFGDSATPAPAPVSHNSKMTINIDGSKDPKAVGEEVRRVLNEEMNKSASRGGY